jgi:hypothetical protein
MTENWNVSHTPDEERVRRARERHRARIREHFGFEPHKLMADYNPLTYPPKPETSRTSAQTSEPMDCEAEWEKARADEETPSVTSVAGIYYGDIYI